VVFAALEGQLGFERRLHALQSHLGASQDFYWLTQAIDLFSGQGDVEGLIDAVLRVDARLLVVDTLAKAIGPASENEGRDVGIVLGALDMIRRETGVHTQLVHHVGKDATRGMRGHSSLLGAADVTQEITREGGERLMRIAKVKDGKDGEQYGFALDVIDLGRDDDGDEITTCIVRETGEASTTSAPREQLTKGERGWMKDLTALFAEPDAAEMLSPASTIGLQACLTRDQVRDGLKRKGRFDLNVDGGLTGSARTMLSRTLNNLRDKGKIGMTDKLVWLLAERQ
jgi:hypothetical protein